MEATTDTTLLVTGGDSLRRAVERLFLAGAHVGPAEPADSLAQLATATPPPTAADLYGPASSLAVPPAATPPVPIPSDGYQLLVLVLGVLYLWLLAHHLGNIYTLIRQTTPRTSALRTNDPRSGNSYGPFLHLATAIGMLFVGVLGLRLAAPQSFAPDVPQVAFSLLLAACGYGVLLLQHGMLHLAGAITLTQDFTTELCAIKRTMTALCSILLAPTLLCYLLTPAGSGNGWLIAILVETVIVLFLFLLATLTLFVSKKVSIFHWILYLCVVELFPISLLWLLISKH